MSRQFIPPLLAIVFGVATGYYTFQPAFKDLQIEKARAQSGGTGSQSLPAEQQPAPPASTPNSKENGDGK
ncbi:hypothetical protein BDV18DRAFT_144987 [Aspergillus unguis]